MDHEVKVGLVRAEAERRVRDLGWLRLHTRKAAHKIYHLCPKGSTIPLGPNTLAIDPSRVREIVEAVSRKKWAVWGWSEEFQPHSTAQAVTPYVQPNSTEDH